MEASFAGPNTGALAGSHYDTNQLESIGANLALALLDYSDPDKSAQAAAGMQRAAQQGQRQPALLVKSLQCDRESSGSMSDDAAAVNHADSAVHEVARGICMLLTASLECQWSWQATLLRLQKLNFSILWLCFGAQDLSVSWIQINCHSMSL